MSNKPLLLVIGKSGTGKNFLCNAFEISSIPSYTTRKKRSTETNLVEHIFVSLKDWEKMKANNEVVVSTFFAGNYYWTTLKQLNNEHYSAYIIDPNGYYDMIEYYKQKTMTRPLKIIYIKSSVLKRVLHMLQRGDNFIKVIERIIHDMFEFYGFEKHAKKMKYLIIKV